MANAEAQIRNEESGVRTLSVSAEILDADNTVAGALPTVSVNLAAGATQVVKLSSRISVTREQRIRPRGRTRTPLQDRQAPP